jgi:hypothetical protein
VRPAAEHLGATFWFAPAAALLFVLLARPLGRTRLSGADLRPEGALALVPVAALGIAAVLLLDGLRCWHVAECISHPHPRHLAAFQRWALLPGAAAVCGLFAARFTLQLAREIRVITGERLATENAPITPRWRP